MMPMQWWLSNHWQRVESVLCQWGLPAYWWVKVGWEGHSYLFPEFSSDVAKSLDPIKTHGLQTSISQHFNHLSVLWIAGERKTQRYCGFLVFWSGFCISTGVARRPLLTLRKANQLITVPWLCENGGIRMYFHLHSRPFTHSTTGRATKRKCEGH